MSQNLLLPNSYKKVGWCILIPSAILGLYFLYMDPSAKQLKIDEFLGIPITVDIANTIFGILFIVGALLVSFSKEKEEDEFISNLRQSSLLWAVLVNYIVLIFCFVFIYGTAFLVVMIYNMFTILIIFIIRFNYILYRTSKSMSDEKYN